MADVDALLPAGAEVLVVEGDAVFLGEVLGGAAHQVVLLVDAVEERRGEGVEAVFCGEAGRLLEAPGVTHLAAAVRQGLGGQGLLEEVAQPVVFVGVEFHADRAAGDIAGVFRSDYKKSILRPLPEKSFEKAWRG